MAGRTDRPVVAAGATLGLIVGLIAGIFLDPYGLTVLYAVLIGTGVGILAKILGLISDALRR